MRKVRLNDSSIKTIMNHISCEMYTRQTIVSLFRCLAETIIESGNNAVITLKINDTKDFQGLLNRLKYAEAKTYIFSNSSDSSYDFSSIKLNEKDLLKDEFLIITADRFSACLFWEETKSEVLDLYQGFCSLNPEDSRKITDYLLSITNSSELEANLNKIKQDRRSNEKSTTILRKFTESFENHQRDLICANTELEELRERINQSEKLASIGQICSTIAHEIRNPLGMINLYAKIISKNTEAVKDTEIGESLRSASKTISDAVVGLEDLLTHILDFSKPFKIEKKDENIETTIKEVLNLVKPAFDEKSVNLSFKTDLNSDVKIKFDREKISQSLLNVIKNALEVSKASDVVEITASLKNKNTVSIKIKDQGQGISAKYREKLFTPFFTTKKQGTGLGLAQSKKILEAHNGSLNLFSSDANGTIFELTLQTENNL